MRIVKCIQLSHSLFCLPGSSRNVPYLLYKWPIMHLFPPYDCPAFVLLIIHVYGKRCTMSSSDRVDNVSSVTGLLAIHTQMCFRGEGVLFMS